ncbi:glycosyltransferase family 2 protein [Parvularcula sp. LCG005]|uniref:glycosyltransferase family A protein n=1 Tax=Parvularcula sp. LCG005 TaxID=3078805 RepID=UPI0029422C26|nr:glycosyltransferase family 2 protein [Parvularcula sp. LCG005]WOI53878.1 glycosyltransferase family 2 protein [Parvularcula sp. LCG005]
MSRLTVAICTYRRPFLAETILSVDAQIGVQIDRVLIVDNDETPSAKTLVEQLQPSVSLPLIYIHAPARNIAIARNAALDAARGDHLAFIDDDEHAAPDWLAHLCTALTPGIAAVFGPVIATYPDDAPAWMKSLSPHSHIVPATRGGIMTGHTASCVIDMTHPAFFDAIFPVDRGVRQSEDSAFFEEAYARGARYVRLDEGLVYEPVLPDRMETDWLLARKARHGRAYGVRQRQGRGWFLAARSAAKWLYCWIAARRFGEQTPQHWRYQIRCALHKGIVRGALTGRIPPGSG